MYIGKKRNDALQSYILLSNKNDNKHKNSKAEKKNGIYMMADKCRTVGDISKASGGRNGMSVDARVFFRVFSLP